MRSNETPARAMTRPATSFGALLTRERQLAIARIALVATITLLYWRGIVPLTILGIVVGLYPLVKTGLVDFVRHRKLGTEIFVTIATVIAAIGEEYVAAAVLMTIILIAEFIAELNGSRASGDQGSDRLGAALGDRPEGRSRPIRSGRGSSGR